VQDGLERLFRVFDGKEVEGDIDESRVQVKRLVNRAPSSGPLPIVRDDYLEVEWTICREGLPMWDLTWVQ